MSAMLGQQELRISELLDPARALDRLSVVPSELETIYRQLKAIDPRYAAAEAIRRHTRRIRCTDSCVGGSVFVVGWSRRAVRRSVPTDHGERFAAVGFGLTAAGAKIPGSPIVQEPCRAPDRLR